VRRKENRRKEAEEKLVAKINPGMGNKYESRKALEKIRGDKRVVDGSSLNLESNDSVKNFTKSSKFFSALQKQTEEDVQRKKDGKGARKINDKNENSNQIKSLAVKL
jgi:hypothetical protein